MNTLAQNKVECESKRRIFVGCLASYNEGIIYGEWLDLSDYYDMEELQIKIGDILKSSPCQGEEYDIQDYEGFGDLLKGDYYPCLSRVWSIHETLLEVEKEDIDVDLFLKFVGCNGDSDQIANEDNFLLSKFQDRYRGTYESLEDYASDLIEQCGDLENVPKYLRNYIDYQSYGKDMELNGDIFTIEKGYREVHIFSNYY